MHVAQEIVEFSGPNGENLVGILSEPPPGVERRRVLLILSHGGLVHKAGAYRAHHHLAGYFAARGYTVFRFDPIGIGDSDGAIPELANRDLFGEIERGRFIKSYQSAFAYLQNRFDDYGWVVSGVCGGAVSSLLAGVESPHRIAGYALISCPVVLDGSQFDYSRREPPAMAMKNMRPYFAKLLKPRAILRFLTFQTDYARLWHDGAPLLLRGKDKVVSKVRSLLPRSVQTQSAPAPDAQPPVGLNPDFVKAAKAAMAKSEVLFIYGNNDGFLWEFTDLYAVAHLSDTKRASVLRIVDRANHMFIWPEWQEHAFQVIEEWLNSTVFD